MGITKGLVVAAGLAVGFRLLEAQSEAQGPVYRGRVELVNVTATVSDESGRFVPGLTQDDFTIYEDNVKQTISYFSASRVPVSLGLVLDTSGSMAGEKIEAARAALDRFLTQLLGPEDEVFLYRFNDQPTLVEDWTTDRTSISRSLGRIVPAGGTALYDAITKALPLAQMGRHPKKAVLLLSDGNDTSSRSGPRDTARLVRTSGVIVYAIGIEGELLRALPPRNPRRLPPRPPPPTFPWPGGAGRRTPPIWRPFNPQLRPGWNVRGMEAVNVAALRELTDDSGGRTEIIANPSALRPATAGIADELSRQYELGYTSSGRKDGQWHSIRVETRQPSYEVRARSGYFAN